MTLSLRLPILVAFVNQLFQKLQVPHLQNLKYRNSPHNGEQSIRATNTQKVNYSKTALCPRPLNEGIDKVLCPKNHHISNSIQ